MTNGTDIFSMLADLRELCSKPSRRIGGPARVPFKGVMPQELPASIGLTLKESAHWIGEDATERDDEALARFERAVDAVTGAAPATFKRVVWASHFIERIALEVEVTILDKRHGREKGKTPVAESKNWSLRKEVLARRFGVFKRIRRIAEELGREVEVSSANTSSELLSELGRLMKIRKDHEAFRRQQKDYKSFNEARASRRFFGTFSAYQQKLVGEAARKRRAYAKPTTLKTTLVVDGELTNVDTTSANVTRRRTGRKPTSSELSN